MNDGNEIRIKTSLDGEFETAVEVREDVYIVTTEDLGHNKHSVVTRTYKKGAIISTTSSDYEEFEGSEGFNEKLLALMRRQHKTAIDALAALSVKKPEEYFEELKMLLRRKSRRTALSLMAEAYSAYPEDPLIVSHYGFLTAEIDGNTERGLSLCKKAFEVGAEHEDKKVNALLYLNYGRALLVADDRKGAHDAFKHGLKFDSKNQDLLWEMQKMGKREGPPIPFLSRGNFINKILGMIKRRLNR